MLFFSSLNAIQYGTLYGFSDFKSISINTLIGAVFEIIFMTLGAYYFSVQGAIVGSGLSYIIIYILNRRSILYHLNKNDIRYKVSLSLADFNIIWRFILPAALSSFLVVPVLWYIKSILVKSEGFGELAVFDISDQWRMIILFIPLSLGKIILPILSRLEANDASKHNWRIINKMIFLNITVCIILSLIIYFISPFIFNLYGKGFDNYNILVIMSLSTVFSSVADVLGQAIASKAKMWIGFTYNLIWCILVISFSKYFLSLGYGAMALALSLLISYIFHSLIQFFGVRHILK